MLPDKPARLLTNSALITFMMGHFTVDMFGGLLPVLYPIMSDRFNLSNADIGFIALAYTAASSLSQPLFGYLADRYGSRNFAVASLVWSASMVGLAGLAPTYPALLAFAMLAGLGSGAYHPQGASNASASVGDERRNTAMSAYTVGGTGGYALGPLIGAVLFGLFGGYGTLAVAPFGFIVAVNMLRQLRRLGLGLAHQHASARAEQRAIPWKLLAPVMVVVMLRSWVSLSVVSFIPIWFKDQGHSSGFYSVLTTLVLAAGAIGTLVGGLLADRIGQRVVLGVSLAAAIPCLLLFAAFPGQQSLLLGPLFGFWSDMGLSITLVIAQRLLPGRVGVASGFILGMGFVTGGIGVPVTGVLADHVGVSHALMLTSSLIVAAALLVTRIPLAALQPERFQPELALETVN
jgi:MFS transporter, FSR family, fosmidomycin resistance protein